MKPETNFRSHRRLQIWFGVLAVVFIAFIARLFYLQIIQHDYWRQQALSDQRREYAIPAERGLIKAHSGGAVVPIVLNQTRYTLFADPALVKDIETAATRLADITGDNPKDYTKAMKVSGSRYQVLAKRLTRQQQSRISKLELPGIGLQEQSYRLYPQGSLAAQVLGFVNDEGRGNYGVEQYLDSQLAGKAGQLKAVTDVNGVPLVASKDNIEVAPQPGVDVVLTIDVAIQKQLEAILQKGLKRAISDSGSAVIVDPYTGAVKAMANWPGYDPARYYDVSDKALFANGIVASPLEVGSVMKVLTAAAALNQGVVKPNSIYNDPGQWELDGHKVTNVEEVGGAGIRSVRDILNLSLNTGATWMLMEMGGGQINSKARERWHDYMVNRYQLGKPTGIEQGYEAGGSVPDPNKGFGLNLAYANTTFGQAMTATPLQLAAALSAVVNGGTYYKPHLVDSVESQNGQAQKTADKVIRRKVVSAKTSRQIRGLMEYMIAHHIFARPFPANYSVGGKTGTPQIANPAGGYYEDRFNGTYIGYVGGNQPQYVIIVRVNEPRLSGFAGSATAQPIFGDIVHMLIDNFGVAPKK